MNVIIVVIICFKVSHIIPLHMRDRNTSMYMWLIVYTGLLSGERMGASYNVQPYNRLSRTRRLQGSNNSQEIDQVAAASSQITVPIEAYGFQWTTTNDIEPEAGPSPEEEPLRTQRLPTIIPTVVI